MIFIFAYIHTSVPPTVDRFASIPAVSFLFLTAALLLVLAAISILTTSLFLANAHKQIVGRNIGPAAWCAH